MIRTIHRAKYVLAEADLLFQDSAVHVAEHGRISRVVPWQGVSGNQEAEVVDWGSAVIIPGLVNAHSHLELTCFHGQLKEFSRFTEWAMELIRRRRKWSREDYLTSVKRGAEESLASGTTLLGDISASRVSWEALKLSRLRKIVFEEVISFVPDRAHETIESLEHHLGSIQTDKLMGMGVSPHAPYSVSPELFQAVSDLARNRRLPIATHLAETKEELEFLKSGTGAIRELLVNLAVLPEGWVPPKLDPISYLESLGVLKQPAVLIHCNYLDPEFLTKILRSRSSVVYCPRSHAFFGHTDHPVRRLLDLGVNVALGTDSLASNNSLSVLDEMRFLFETRKDLSIEEIFRMATLNGAAALGLGGVLGRIRRGHWADMTILGLPVDIGPKHLIAQILEGAGECIGTIVQGDIVWKRR
jgi:cytosine/adenosine deaminase-related metal-dependent hydrolase